MLSKIRLKKKRLKNSTLLQMTKWKRGCVSTFSVACVCVNGKIKLGVHKYIIANIHTQAKKQQQEKILKNILCLKYSFI